MESSPALSALADNIGLFIITPLFQCQQSKIVPLHGEAGNSVALRGNDGPGFCISGCAAAGHRDVGPDIQRAGVDDDERLTPDGYSSSSLPRPCASITRHRIFGKARACHGRRNIICRSASRSAWESRSLSSAGTVCSLPDSCARPFA